MGKSEALAAVGKLALAYRQELSPESAAVYAENLQDIPVDLLGATVQEIIEHGKFFPAISELRMTAARIAGLVPLAPAEALAIVRRADVSRPVFRRDGTLAYTEREWDWPEDVDDLTMDSIRDTLSRVGEPQDSEGKAYFGWETGFQKSYETTVEPSVTKALRDLSQARLPEHRKLLGTGR